MTHNYGIIYPAGKNVRITVDGGRDPDSKYLIDSPRECSEASFAVSFFRSGNTTFRYAVGEHEDCAE